MPASAAADQADLLARATYYQVAHTLRSLLPPPVAKTQEDAARRDIDAIRHVAALYPATAEEAHIACMYVASQAHAADCLRLARVFDKDELFFHKCTAQAGSMMRQALRWHATLKRVQTERGEREKSDAARAIAETLEQQALGMLGDALLHNAPPPAPEATAAPAPAPTEAPGADPIQQAEYYALHHRKRALLVRSLGRLPQKFGWLPPEVVHAIAAGDTPILRALGERKPARAAPAAA